MAGVVGLRAPNPNFQDCSFQAKCSPRTDTKRGCLIYSDRPQPCRDFTCLWRDGSLLPDDLRPDLTRVILFRLVIDGCPEGVLCAVLEDGPTIGETKMGTIVRDLSRINPIFIADRTGIRVIGPRAEQERARYWLTKHQQKTKGSHAH